MASRDVHKTKRAGTLRFFVHTEREGTLLCVIQKKLVPWSIHNERADTLSFIYTGRAGPLMKEELVARSDYKPTGRASTLPALFIR